MGMGLAACANASISGRKKGESLERPTLVGSEKRPKIYMWDELANGTELSLPEI